MKKLILFIGKNTIPTIAVAIITLVVFATSVYGFVRVANLNSPIRDIPEVESVEDNDAEDVTPTPVTEIEEIEQEDLLGSPTPTVIQQNESDQAGAEVRRKNKRDDTEHEVDDDTEDVNGDNDRERSRNSRRDVDDR